MGAYQTGRNIVVAWKLNGSTYGTAAASGGGAAGFRPTGGSLGLSKGTIQSRENRRDGMTTRGRHGQRAVQGSYSAEVSVGTFDELFEAAMRGTWSGTTLVQQSTPAMSSATLSCTSSVITASGGSFITAGLRVGDVFTMTAGLTGNLNRNLTAIGVTATTITVRETLTPVAGPVATWSISIKKKLLQGLTERDFSVEEQDLDIDISERFDGVRVTGFDLEMSPNGLLMVTLNMMGKDMTPLSGGSSPYFTSPTFTTSLPMGVVDASLMLGGTALVEATALRLSYTTNPTVTEVLAAQTTPDVFLNLATVTGSVTVLRKDLSYVTAFMNETQQALHLLATENTNEPKNFFGFCATNLTLGGVNKSALGSDGPRTQEIPFIIGVDEAGGAFDPTMIKLMKTV